MKVLIWVGWFLIVTLVNLLIDTTTGVRLGLVALYLLVIFPARAMCKWWDWRTADKKADNDNFDSDLP